MGLAVPRDRVHVFHEIHLLFPSTALVCRSCEQRIRQVFPIAGICLAPRALCHYEPAGSAPGILNGPKQALKVRLMMAVEVIMAVVRRTIASLSRACHIVPYSQGVALD